MSVEKLGLRVMIYGIDMARFRSGKSISIEARPEREQDTAILLTPGERVQSKNVAAELKMDPKTGKGSIAIDGKPHRVLFRRLPGKPQFCG